MYGNVAPGGGVAKITGKEGETFTGVAKVYDSEPAMLDGILKREIKCGQVVIIRYEGPKGGPGLPEMLTPTSAIMGAGWGTALRSSQMVDFLEEATASASGTSRRRPRSAGPSPSSRTATPSRSTRATTSARSTSC